MASNRTTDPRGWRVFRTASPPAQNSAAAIGAFNSWPCTDAVCSDAQPTLSAWTGGGLLANAPVNAWYFVWANRAAPPNQSILPPNPIQSPPIFHPVTGFECRVNYSTVERANAATRCLIRYWLGRSDFMDPWLHIAGTSASDFVTYAQLRANPAAYFNTTFAVADAHLKASFSVMNDRPWLPSAPATAVNPSGLYQRTFMMPGAPRYQTAPGIVLDYEVGDVRTTGTGPFASDPNGSLNFIKAIYADLHATADSRGRSQVPAKLVLWLDPLNGRSMAHSGLDASNLGLIARNYADLMSVQLYGGNVEGSIPASYADQIAVLKASGAVPYSKLFLTLDLAGARLSDTAFVNRLLNQGPAAAPQAVWFWDDGAAPCSSAAEAKILMTLLGRTTV